MTVTPGTALKLTGPKTARIRLADGSDASVHLPAETVVEHEGAGGDDHAWSRGTVHLRGEVVYQLEEVEPADWPDALAEEEEL